MNARKHSKTGVTRIIVQPSTKRIHHDALYEDVGCDISEDLSKCGLILGIKQPKLDMILPDRVHFSPILTRHKKKICLYLIRASLFDYELIVGDHGRRSLAFGKFAGRAGMIDFLRGLGQRYLNLGYSTPFLLLGVSYMYSSLAAAKAACWRRDSYCWTSIRNLSPRICFHWIRKWYFRFPLPMVHKKILSCFLTSSRLPGLFETARNTTELGRTTKRVFQVYGCVVTSQDMVEHKDPSKFFDNAWHCLLFPITGFH
ncbi:unnamed protein product [Fraxinus pennsylvanica]|uniref:Alanine dehydrogenase/pyridine nucleotide transhydrogenase N-terminal domain-containing protein n=1 Tax=Fraxinus pennsylvanica TaxID=56036 RepID=A0AAD1Z0M0_9LAMI|nr:unnamed protein product [Fraxinus pennsylvanica]